MRIPGFRRRSRAAVSTVIGTIIFIIAALSIFTALAATNVAGMNYQNAAQQASNRNGVKSQELIQAAPVYDTSAYAEFSATESTNAVNFGMSYTSPVDWTEAALAVNNTAGITLMQHYANACPGSQVCSLTLTYPPAVNNTLVVGVSISNVGSSLSGSVSVTDNRGLTMTLRNASSLQSGNSYFASQIWTSGYVVSGSETHRITVTVSGSKAPSDTFSVFVYDIAAGKSPVYTSRHTSALAPTPIGVTKVPGHNHFFLAVVTAPSSWQALPAPGFTLESSPPRPSELTLTNGWSSTTSFTTVIYVYHMWSGSYNATLGQYVEAFNPNSGTCISPTGTAALSTGLTCTYAVPRGTVGQGLAKPFNLTDSGQKLSVGFTTALGNTFWYNYTGYVAMNLGPSSNAGYPYVPDISDLINTVVARGLGPAKLTFPAFTYYWNGGGAGGIGSGFNVDGYFGFAVPTGVSVVWEVNITNYDPQQRTVTILSPSQLTLVSASSGASPTSYPIVGAITDSADDQAVTAGAFNPTSLGYKESAILRFASTITKTPIVGAYMAEVVLVGFYQGNVPFAQILPVSATFVISGSVSGSQGNWCKVGTGTNGPTCTFAYPSAKGDPKLTSGGTYTFALKGFGAPTSVYILTSQGGKATTEFTDITGTVRTSTAVSFTVPVGTVPGFYEFDISDGLNRVSVTVQVVAP